MFAGKHPIVVLVALALMLCLTMSVSAQGDTLGSLLVGQPVISQISAEAPVARYDLSVEEAGTVAIQAFGETAQPALAILRDGAVVASAANAEGDLIVDFSAMLTAGSYVVEVSGANNTAGAVILVVQSLTPISITDLVEASVVDGEVNDEAPMALFRLNALNEPSFVYVQSTLPNSGAIVRLTNETSGSQSGMFAADLLGGRFNIPAGSQSYLVEVEHSGAEQAEPFSICWAVASADGCEVAPVVIGLNETEEAPAQPVAACTVTPAGGAVNVRASASIEAPIIATLASGTSAEVIGVAPGGFFFNIQLGGVNGWVAASVVNATGDCANVATVQPPQFQPVPTQPPQPTQAPAQPTEPPQEQPNPEPQPTQPPQQDPPQQPSGPCLLTANSPVFIYTQPTAQVDFLQDQVQAGGEMIPNGRLSDGSWWRLNSGAWVQTGLFGGAITVSGNCNLPVVTFDPPPSGPCLLTLNSAVNVYTQPVAQVDFLQDQVQAGGELIPNGRLSDGSWWRTNYGGAWVQTGLFGGAITVSGNCNNLPVINN